MQMLESLLIKFFREKKFAKIRFGEQWDESNSIWSNLIKLVTLSIASQFCEGYFKKFLLLLLLDTKLLHIIQN